MKTYREILSEGKKLDLAGLQKMVKGLDGNEAKKWGDVVNLLKVKDSAKKAALKRAGKIISSMDTAARDYGDKFIPGDILDQMGLNENSNDDADLEFVAGQFINDEASSDKEMVTHLTKQTGLDPKVIKKLVKGARSKVLAMPLSSYDKIHAVLKKYL